ERLPLRVQDVVRQPGARHLRIAFHRRTPPRVEGPLEPPSTRVVFHDLAGIARGPEESEPERTG
ncbi:hypothetical protein ACYOEI_41170, partial [Singulisphaera rosea]